MTLLGWLTGRRRVGILCTRSNTSACQVNPRNMFWPSYIDSFLEPWPEALKMEKVRQKWWEVV